jgi:Uma2 family endonuclease
MNVIATRAAEGLARRSFTVAEIRRMVDAGIIAEDENIELIDGEIVALSPKGNRHEVTKSALVEHFVRSKPKDVRLGIETTVYLDERTFVEPDVCLYPKRILPEDVRGTDLILTIEIAATSMAYDRKLKAGLYARHRIAEFWVVDAATGETFVHRGPRQDGSWESIERVASDPFVTPAALPGCSVGMGDLD